MRVREPATTVKLLRRMSWQEQLVLGLHLSPKRQTSEPKPETLNRAGNPAEVYNTLGSSARGLED